VRLFDTQEEKSPQPKHFMHQIDVIGPPNYDFAISFSIIPIISKLLASYQR